MGNPLNNTCFFGITWYLIWGSTTAEWHYRGFSHWLFGLLYAKKCHHRPFAARCCCYGTRGDTPSMLSQASRRKAGLRRSAATCWTMMCILCVEGFQETSNPIQPLMVFTELLLFDISVALPPVPDLAKFGHASTDAVHRAGSDRTCSYCNHMFKQTFKPLKKYLYSQMWLMCLLNQVQAMTGMRTLRKWKQSNQEVAIGLQVLSISAKEVRGKRAFLLPEHWHFRSACFSPRLCLSD